MSKAIVILPDGKIIQEETSFDKFKDDHLKGGYIEMLRLNNESHAYIDEEGKIKNLPYNENATKLCGMLNVGLGKNDVIVGPMCIFGTLPLDGEDHDVPVSLSNAVALLVSPS